MISALIILAQLTVVPDSMHSYLTVNGHLSRQICSEGVASSIFTLNNAHTINCFASGAQHPEQPNYQNPRVINGQVWLEVNGLPSGGSSIIETTCYLEWYRYTRGDPAHGIPQAPAPWPTMPCERARVFQVFDANAKYVGQGDSWGGPLLPVVRYVHFTPPTSPPPTAVATVVPSTPIPTIVPATPLPTLIATQLPTTVPPPATPTLEPRPTPIPPTPQRRPTGWLIGAGALTALIAFLLWRKRS